MMDIYQPDSTIGSAPRPAIVTIHGGAWMAGNRQMMTAWCEKFAQAGFVAATVSYRLAPKYKWPTMLDDVQTATRYLRTKAKDYNLDPGRIGAAGHSAGGHLALMLGSCDTWDKAPTVFADQSSRVRAVLSLAGPTDLRYDYPPAFDFAFAAVLGKPKAEAGEVIERASPVTHIDAKSAPAFLIQGRKDTTVAPRQAERLVDVLQKAKVPFEIVWIPEMGHVPAPNDTQFDEAFSQGIKFLGKMLASGSN